MPPEAAVFFIDRSLGRRWVAEAQMRAGLRVEIHDDHFPPKTTDVEWMHVVGRRGWIVLTKDDRIRRRPLERNALIAARLRMFVVKATQAEGSESAPRWKWNAAFSKPTVGTTVRVADRLSATRSLAAGVRGRGSGSPQPASRPRDVGCGRCRLEPDLT